MAYERFKVPTSGMVAVGNSEITGNLTITDTLYIGNSSFEFNTNSVSVPTVAATNVDAYSTNTYHFAKYFVTMTSGTKYHALEVILVNQGSNVSIATYGEVFNNHLLGTVDANVISDNVVLTIAPAANSLPLTVSTYRTIQV